MIDREGPIHRAIMQYLRLTMPSALVHHSANEIPLSGKNVARAISKAKWNGMVPGFPDIVVLPFSHVGPMFFEVKAKGNGLTDAQKAVMGQLTDLGYKCAVVRSVDDVKAKLTEWAVWNEPAAVVEMRGKIG